MPLIRVLEAEVMDTAAAACEYDAMDHAQVNRAFVADLIAVWNQTLISPLSDTSDAPPVDVLDLGTGTALIPIELCEQLAHCRVMAGDASTAMLDLAVYNIASACLSARIQLTQLDAKKLEYADAYFDLVMSNSIIHHIPEPLCVLREALRVTKPGGLLFFRDLLRPHGAAELAALVETHAADANDHQRRMFAESLHAALTLAEIRDLVTSLGFPAETVTATSDRHWTWAAQKV